LPHDDLPADRSDLVHRLRLIAIGPIVAEANQAAPRPLTERVRSPHLMTVAGVFLAFLGAGMIASLRWSSRVFGTPMWDTALLRQPVPIGSGRACHATQIDLRRRLKDTLNRPGRGTVAMRTSLSDTGRGDLVRKSPAQATPNWPSVSYLEICAIPQKCCTQHFC
jgi:hypothetical protein